jgi:14-3-3 protein epsilon
MRTLAATCDEELTDEERNLFSVALKNVLQSLRSSIAVAKAMELRERQLANDDGAALAKGYAQKLSAELSRFCSSTIEAIERRLSTPTESSAHARVFYLKLLGDYWRYTCEVDIDADKRDEAIAHCTDAYEVGVELAATSGLTMCDPIRLGLYLNQTVFLYEIVGKHSGAIAISNACICAFESAREAIGVAPTSPTSARRWPTRKRSSNSCETTAYCGSVNSNTSASARPLVRAARRTTTRSINSYKNYI